MARRRHEENPRIVNPYEEVYDDFRTVVETAVDRFGTGDDIRLILGQAQAEALMRTLKSFSLRGLSVSDKAAYLHFLFSQMLSDCLEGEKRLVGKLLVKVKSKPVKTRAK